MTRKVRIGFLLPHYSQRSKSLMPAVVRALAEDGAIVDVVHPVEQMVDLSAVRVEHDLYVLRRWGGLALSMAAALHELGATIVNPHPATAALRDKIVTARILLAAGVPTPLSCIAMGPEQLAPMLDGGPIIVKPYTGGNGQRIHIVEMYYDTSDGRGPLSRGSSLGKSEGGQDPAFLEPTARRGTA